MPNRWIEFVKNWAKDNNTSYGCALTKPEMRAEYHYRYPKVKTKGVAKLEESRPPLNVKSKVTYPNLKIRIPPPEEDEEENMQFDMEDMGGAEEPARRRRGRPQVYLTAEEKYKAKLESNKQKRRERAAAKKVRGGMMTADTLQLTKKKDSSSTAATTAEHISERIPANLIGNRFLTKNEREEMIQANKDKKRDKYTTIQDLREDPTDNPNHPLEIARLKRIAANKSKQK
jgi:hypothetical protein